MSAAAGARTACVCVQMTRAACACKTQAAEQGQCLIWHALPYVGAPQTSLVSAARRAQASSQEDCCPRGLAARAAWPVTRLVAAAAAPRPTSSKCSNFRRAFSLNAVSAHRRRRMHARGFHCKVGPVGTRLYTICCPSALRRPPVSSSSNAFPNTLSLIGLRAAPQVGSAHCHHSSAAMLLVTPRLLPTTRHTECIEEPTGAALSEHTSCVSHRSMHAIVACRWASRRVRRSVAHVFVLDMSALSGPRGCRRLGTCIREA